jgi:23S rRNA (cytosine1962-C5)-methyltransferase
MPPGPKSPRPSPSPAAPSSLSLSPDASSFVRGGGRDVVLQKLELPLGLVPGQPLTLLDDQGDELALALHDPENGLLRVYATPEDGFRKIEAGLLGWRVEQACKLRRDLGLMEPDACYRVVHGAGDALPGFSCDAFGAFGVLWVYAEALWPTARLLAEAIAGFAKLDGVVIKQRSRTTAADGEVKQEVIGKAPPERYEAKESGVPFEIHPLSGLNAGLFTDMREHRKGLARFTAGRRVLNLFSYTGALSVTCARAGAATVTSVDTSAGVQAWAQGNFKRNALVDDKRWRFETGDAVRFLARADKDRERYDLILIDPPTFSTARGKAWTLDRDYPELIGQAAQVLPPGGLLWLAANTHELGSLARLAHKGLRNAGRVGSVIEQGSLPPDYPTLLAQARDRYLQICLLRVA